MRLSTTSAGLFGGFSMALRDTPSAWAVNASFQRIGCQTASPHAEQVKQKARNNLTEQTLVVVLVDFQSGCELHVLIRRRSLCALKDSRHAPGR